MSHPWQAMADALREEAAEYGRLLGLFEEQIQTLFRRTPEETLMLSHTISDQAQLLQQLRLRREGAVTAFAAFHGRPANATLRSLLDLLPAEARPLFEALIGEINRLIHRVRRSSRLNYRLLGCMVECHQEVLRRLRPDAFTKTYAPNGRVSLGGMGRMPAMQTAG